MKTLLARVPAPRVDGAVFTCGSCPVSIRFTRPEHAHAWAPYHRCPDGAYRIENKVWFGQGQTDGGSEQ